MQTIKVRKLAYLGHVLRYTRYKLLQVIIMSKVAGKTVVGSRKESWLRDFQEWIGTVRAELFNLAKDRGKYAELTFTS